MTRRQGRDGYVGNGGVEYSPDNHKNARNGGRSKPIIVDERENQKTQSQPENHTAKHNWGKPNAEPQRGHNVRTFFVNTAYNL